MCTYIAIPPAPASQNKLIFPQQDSLSADVHHSNKLRFHAEEVLRSHGLYTSRLRKG